MANIQPYTSDVSADTQVQTKTANGESAGSGIQSFGTAVENYGVTALDNSIRMGKAKNDTLISKATLDFETQMSKQTSSFDPNDPDAQDDQMAGFNAAIQKIKDNTNDPKVLEYTENRVAEIQPKYWNLMLHHNAEIQGKEYGSMIDERIDQDTQSVSLNPSLLQTKIDGLKDLYEYHPGQNAKGIVDKSIEDISKKLSVAAVKGRIYASDEDPSDVLADLQAGKYNVGGAADQLMESAQREITSRDKQATANDKAAVNLQKQTQVKNFQDLTNQIDSGQASFSQINKMADDGVIDGIHRGLAEKRLQAMVDGTQKSDPMVKQELFKDMRLPDGDPNKPQDFTDITARYGHGLSQKDLQQASSIFLAPPGSDQDIKAGMQSLSQAAAKQLIKPTDVPWGDRQGVANWSSAINDMHDTYQKNIQSGKVTAQEMFDPTNKAYLGNIIQKYQRSRSQITQDATQTLYGPPSAAPGVTVAPPVGINPKGPPISSAPQKQAPTPSGPALTPAQKAAIDALSSRYGGGNK